MNADGVIGKKGITPWHYSADLKTLQKNDFGLDGHHGAVKPGIHCRSNRFPNDKILSSRAEVTSAEYHAAQFQKRWNAHSASVIWVIGWSRDLRIGNGAL